MNERAHLIGFVAAAACIVSGCAGGSKPSSLPELPKVDLPNVELPKVELPNVEGQPPPPGFEMKVAASPVEVYTRVARGALSCWFGARGPLKQDYAYHANAAPPSRGGQAEINIHVRDFSSPNPRGVKAYGMTMTPDSPEQDSTVLVTVNKKLPEPLARFMDADVRRWATGDASCSEAANAWAPQQEAPPEPETKNKKKRSKTAKGTI